jgi:hypothetical protein
MVLVHPFQSDFVMLASSALGAAVPDLWTAA